MEGQMNLSAEGHETTTLKAGDAFVIPPGLIYKLGSISDNLELLEVSLPGSFNTTKH